MWKLFSQIMGTPTLESLDQFMQGQLGITGNKDMQVVGHDLKCKDLYPFLVSYLSEYSFKPLLDIIHQNRASPFRTPDKMIINKAIHPLD